VEESRSWEPNSATVSPGLMYIWMARVTSFVELQAIHFTTFFLRFLVFLDNGGDEKSSSSFVMRISFALDGRSRMAGQ